MTNNFMKNTVIILILVFITASLHSQDDYTITHKAMAEKSKDLRYEFSVSYPLIITFSGNPEIPSYDKFNKLIESKMEALRDTFIVWMNDWDTSYSNKEMGSYYEAGDTVYYASNKLISVHFFEGYYFSGAAHPNNSSFSVNYDLVNRKELILNDLLKSGWENRISELCIADIRKQKRDMGIEPDEWLKEGAGPNAKNFEVFNITAEGLLITFITYQVGSYVEGPSEVLIKYNEIKDLIPAGSYLGDFLK